MMFFMLCVILNFSAWLFSLDQRMKEYSYFLNDGSVVALYLYFSLINSLQRFSMFASDYLTFFFNFRLGKIEKPHVQLIIDPVHY